MNFIKGFWIRKREIEHSQLIRNFMKLEMTAKILAPASNISGHVFLIWNFVYKRSNSQQQPADQDAF